MLRVADLTLLAAAEGHHDSALTHALYTAIAFLGVADHKVSKSRAESAFPLEVSPHASVSAAVGVLVLVVTGLNFAP